MRARIGSALPFLGHLSWSVAGYGVARLAVLFAGMEISRGLGTSDFAGLAYFLITLNLIGALADSGVSIALVRYGVEALSGKDRESALRRALAAILLSTLVWFVTVVLVYRFTQVRTWQWEQVAIVALSGLVCTWQASCSALLLAASKMRGLFIGNMLFAIAVLGSVQLATHQGDVEIAKSGFLAAYGAQFLWNLSAVWRSFGRTPKDWMRLRKADFLAVFRMVGVMAGTSALAALLPWYVGDAISRMPEGKTGLAVFAVALNLFGIVMAIPSRIGQIFFVNQLHQENPGCGPAGHRRRAALSADLLAASGSSLVLAATIAVLFQFGDLLLSRYGAIMVAHGPPIFLFLMIGIAANALAILGNRIVACNRPILWFIVTAVQLLTSVTFLKIAPIDASWAAVGTYTASYAIALLTAIICYIFATRRST